MALSAAVAELMSANTTHACPLSRWPFITTISTIFPNWEKTAYRHFFISTVQRQHSVPETLCEVKDRQVYYSRSLDLIFSYKF